LSTNKSSHGSGSRCTLDTLRRCRLALQCGRSHERSRCLLLRIRSGPRACCDSPCTCYAAARARRSRCRRSPWLHRSRRRPSVLADAVAAALLAEPEHPPVHARRCARACALLRSLVAVVHSPRQRFAFSSARLLPPSPSSLPRAPPCSLPAPLSSSRILRGRLRLPLAAAAVLFAAVATSLIDSTNFATPCPPVSPPACGAPHRGPSRTDYEQSVFHAAGQAPDSPPQSGCGIS
jgi:hypothetical protein